jgi:glycyl-tRNA synthetase beta chain
MNVDETKPLLIELFTEELPPKALRKLGVAFQQYLWESLAGSDLVFAAQEKLEWFATPRRLAARFDKVRSKAPLLAIKDKLMPLSVARTVDGHVSPALLKKLSSTKVDQLLKGKIDFPATYTGEGGRKISLVVESDGKTEYVFLVGEKEGDSIEQGVQRAIDYTLAKLPIPKVMNYQLADGVTEANFVRPAHGLVAMYGSDVIKATALGLTSSNISHGHRFQGANNIEIDTASRYEELLRQYGKVEPVFAKRRDMILSQLEAKAKALNATLGSAESYADLLDEVNSLVEWPTVYVCQFEEEFLAVPQECLILTMKTNQKYFPLFDASGKLKNQFLIVSNMELDDPSKIIQGNERVVRPRLSDARFFFETDKKTKLESRVPELAKVVYHNKLGTQGERVARVAKLAGEIATMIGANKANAERAATLAKADLMTLMVGEFPELQGTMGRYYTALDGEQADVAAACAEHYQPRFAGDALPSPGVPAAVALADKIETLVGLFGIGQVPTGDKDPFALRRHALGVLRILIEHALPIDLRELMRFAANTFGSRISAPDEAKEKAFVFVTDRLAVYLRDGGFNVQVREAVFEVMGDRAWGELPARLAAVTAFSALPEAASLNAANKRVANILKKAEEAKEAIAANSAPQDPAEAELRNALNTIAPKADALFAKGDFTGYLKSFAALKTPVDEFFDKVMVMAEDKAVRANRLALLRDLRDAMNKVADLSKLAT